MAKFITYPLIILICFFLSFCISYRQLTSDLHQNSLQEVELYAKTFSSKLDELRPVNKIMSFHPAIKAALSDQNNVAKINRANRVLQVSRNLADAAQIYLMDPYGLTIASSNFNEPKSFVGNNYSYRPYFTQAVSGLSGRFYAIGINSNKRGYYFSEPVYDGNEIIGVIVLKVDIVKLEKILLPSESLLMILDNFGIVFLSNQSQYLYHKTRPLSEPALKYLDFTKRYKSEKLKDAQIEPLKFWLTDHLVKIHHDGQSKDYIRSVFNMPELNWDVSIYTLEDEVRYNAYIIAAIASTFILLLLFVIDNIRYRRRMIVEQINFKNKQADELERRVAERSEELKVVQDELVKTAKLAALGQMSAAISHELSQPLTAMNNYAQNTKLFLQKNRIDEAEKNVNIIGDLADKMAAIIRHIKIFAQNRSPEITTIAINKVVRETAWFMQSSLKNKQVKLELHLEEKADGSDIMIMANAVRIEQVLMNLISNALDSMARSDVKILNIQMSHNDDMVMIEIRDTGEGIEEDFIEHIFKPFYTTKENDNGMGLGLSISKTIIEEFDGIMEAYNRPNGGAKFTIQLPIKN